MEYGESRLSFLVGVRNVRITFARSFKELYWPPQEFDESVKSQSYRSWNGALQPHNEESVTTRNKNARHIQETSQAPQSCVHFGA